MATKKIQKASTKSAKKETVEQVPLNQQLISMAASFKEQALSRLSAIGKNGAEQIGKASDRKSAGAALKDARGELNLDLKALKMDRKAILNAIGKSADLEAAAKDARKALREAYDAAKAKHAAAVARAQSEKTPEANKAARETAKAVKQAERNLRAAS